MKIISGIAMYCLMLLAIFIIVLLMIDMSSKMKAKEYIPIEDMKSNYIINGEEVYCGIIVSNAFGTGITLFDCSNGRTYHNAINVVELK